MRVNAPGRSLASAKRPCASVIAEASVLSTRTSAYGSGAESGSATTTPRNSPTGAVSGKIVNGGTGATSQSRGWEHADIARKVTIHHNRMMPPPNDTWTELYELFRHTSLSA